VSSHRKTRLSINMLGESVKAVMVVGLFLLFVDSGMSEITDVISEGYDRKPESCVGSVKIFDDSDKEIYTVSHKDDPDKKLPVNTSGKKARMEGNCCSPRQKPEGKGGKSMMFTDHRDYQLEFKVKYMKKTDCPDSVPGAGTALIPILITVAVVVVLAIVAVIVYVKKRNSGHSPVSTQP